MPFFLVIVLAPKVAFLNDAGEVIVRRTSSVVVTSSKCQNLIQPSTTSGRSVENTDSSVPSTKGIAMNQSETGSSTEMESLEGDILQLDETELSEINIRGFVIAELDKLYAEYVICARPTVVDDESGNSMQAMCICERDSVDTVMGRLAFYGVGNLVGSINVLSLESSKFFRAPKPTTPVLSASNLDTLQAQNNSELGDVEMGSMGSSPQQSAAAAEAEQTQRKKTLIGEVASQIRVEQVVETIEGSATMDFDYIALLTVASVIAGIGLATNNTVSIVASMLVSPLMGPVMACTFGTIVNKWSLVRLGAWSELCSLLWSIVIGFCIGLVTMAVGTRGSWPTLEMRTRGFLDSLLVGVAVAIPSGAGVALSVLSNNVNSLVGVAISASLLPPAVNCGLCLAYAACGYEVDPDRIDDLPETKLNNEYLQLGGISLALTVVNIGAIYLSGCLMFRLKEVAPLQDKQAFWQRDTHVFRQLMQTSLTPEPASTDSAEGSQRKLPFDRYDLKAQVRMLKEVEKDPVLRRQLQLDIDDVMIDMSSPVVGKRNRSSVRKPRQQHKHRDRGDVLMELFRSEESDAHSGPHAHHSHFPHNSHPAVDTSSVRTAPSHLYAHTASYAPRGSLPVDTGRPESVAAVGHSGVTGTLGLSHVSVDMSDLKARLRKGGKSVRIARHPHK